MKRFFALLMLAAAAAGCSADRDGGFVTVRDGQFIAADGRPLYFAGTNLWYGAVLAADGPSCDRERLCRELDRLKQMGVCNLRIAVGAEGDEDDEVKIKPILQTAAGEYDDAALDGLDFLMAEIARRDMQAVLYLTNSWTWSGGWCQYLEWGGEGEAPVAERTEWSDYTAFAGRFIAGGPSSEARRMFDDHIRFIVTRTNRYTGRAYRDDPAIFAWQLCNEPRPFAKENKERFFEWVALSAKLIKQLDPNHMVSTGSEGEIGCERDLELWRRILALPEIDYGNIHIWPYTWRWIDRENIEAEVESACLQSSEYIDLHLAVAREFGKPLVIEEFGYHRDGRSFDPSSPVSARDKYYEHILGRVTDSAREGDALAGCNFWSWSGECRPVHLFWANGDPYCGDPAQEEQGLYSVFDCDSSTLRIISTAALGLQQRGN